MFEQPDINEIATLHNMVKKFSANLLATFGEAAIRQTILDMSEDEAKLASRAEAMMSFNESAEGGATNTDDSTQTMGMLLYMSASLPALKRQFGEAALVEALPEEAHRTRMINICDYVGARDVAALCRQTRTYKR